MTVEASVEGDGAPLLRYMVDDDPEAEMKMEAGDGGNHTVVLPPLWEGQNVTYRVVMRFLGEDIAETLPASTTVPRASDGTGDGGSGDGDGGTGDGGAGDGGGAGGGEKEGDDEGGHSMPALAMAIAAAAILAVVVVILLRRRGGSGQPEEPVSGDEAEEPGKDGG